jgi:hypothetical protein
MAASALILQTELSAIHLAGQEKVHQGRRCQIAEYQRRVARVCHKVNMAVY